MTAPIAKSNLAFELPRQTYINVRLEEPNLYAAPVEAPRPGFWARLADAVTVFVARHREAAQAAELRAMTDRELADIGISRGDIDRVFSREYSRDLREARALLG